jgi:hypothetical protein
MARRHLLGVRLLFFFISQLVGLRDPQGNLGLSIARAVQVMIIFVFGGLATRTTRILQHICCSVFWHYLAFFFGPMDLYSLLARPAKHLTIWAGFYWAFCRITFWSSSFLCNVRNR